MLSAEVLLAEAEAAHRQGHHARAWNLATLGLQRTPGAAQTALTALRASAERALTAARTAASARPPSARPPLAPGVLAPAAPPSPELVAATAALKRGSISDAIALLDRLIADAPDHAGAHSLRGMALLTLGRFEAGFADYEWRQGVRGFEGDPPPAPRWDGRPLDGGTLLLWDEQGLGDTIQFVRFAEVAARRSRARVILHAHPRICRLLRGCPGVAAVAPRDGRGPAADAQLSLMSVPATLGLGGGELEADLPYVRAEPALVTLWRERLDRLSGPIERARRPPRIGLVWQGNPSHPEDARRSIPFEALRPLVERCAPSATFISLQKGAGRRGLESAALPLIDLDGELDNGPDAFIDSAAVISGLDLVITSDTAIAHLAGALGSPVWIVLARPCDWRWGTDGPRTTFYSTARLFRQPRPDAWTDALAAVAAALEDSFPPRG